MASDYDFLNTPGPLPWRLECAKRKPKNGVIYDADGRVVCVAAIGNAREIVRMANHYMKCKHKEEESNGQKQ